MRGLLLAVLLMMIGAGAAHAQRAQWKVDGRAHVDVPFVLEMIIDGFDGQPAPIVPPPKIDGATVTAMPVGPPQVARQITDVNGRREVTQSVRWSVKFKVEVHKEGRVNVPEGHALQGARSAVAAAGGMTVDTIPLATDMKLQLVLPDRPVFVGETVDAQLVWLFRDQPADQTFTVPLMASDDVIASAAPVVPGPNGKAQALAFSAGGKDIPVPYAIDDTDVGGTQYHRITFAFTVAPRKVGKIEVPAASVVASMPYGERDFFGNSETRPVRAIDVAHTLDVRPLPETDKPAAFAGAVGEKFSIAVTASRSVVQLGEPVDLQIVVKNDQRLDAFALGDLAGDGGLPKDKFSVPREAPTGELSEDGKTKTFAVTAQVTGPATEIPAIALAYFDPRAGAYKTVKSEPIALSVKGGSIVGADSVVSGVVKKPGTGPAAPAGGGALDTGATVGAQLALSTAGVDDAPLGGSLLWAMVALLYLVPLGVFGARTWQLRTKTSRAESAGVRAARKKLDDALDAAAKQPARAAVGALVGALRDYTRAIAVTPGRELDDLIGTLETEAFAPEAADRPIGAARIAEVRAAAERWLAKRPVAAATTKKVASTAVLVLFALAALGRGAQAAPEVAAPPNATDAQALAAGRAAYGEALDANDASAKRAAFARAAVALRQVAAAHPSADLLGDWGNAALGAGDVGSATLAYRRALALDAGNARARGNLELLRGRVPDLMKPTDGGAADSLLFFHRWTRAKKLVVGGAAFALAILMLVPWRGRRRRGLVNLAILPALVWIAMLVSTIAENRHATDAVVMDDSVLRAADSTGAPAAIPQVLARGTEVTVLEKRAGWTRVQIASGKDGWLPTGTIEMVVL